MATSLTVTITNMNMSSKGRFKTYEASNYGQALGIARCCLTHWSGMAHIVGFKADGTFVDEHYIVEGVRIIKIDRHQAQFYWDMAWNVDEDYVEPVRTPMTYNVYNIVVSEEPRVGLLTRAVKWLKTKFIG